MVFYTSRRHNQPSGSSQRAEGGGAPQRHTTRAGGGRRGDTRSHRAPARQHRSRHGWQGWGRGRHNQPSGSSRRAEGGRAPQPHTTRAGEGRRGDTGSRRAPARQHRSRHGWQGWERGAARGGGAWSSSGERLVAKAYRADCKGEGHSRWAARSDAPPPRTALVPGGVRGGRALQTAIGQQRTALAAHPARGGLCVGHRLSSRTGARPPQSPWLA